MIILGLTGAAGSGKDTVAAHLVRRHHFTQLAFADPLRAMVAAGFGVTARDLERDRKELPLDWLGVSPRYLLQTLGTDWGRGLIDPDVWLLVLKRRLDMAIEEGRLRFVISDVRFENEAALVRGMGGAVWHLRRPGTAPVHQHVSEAGVRAERGDHIINNAGSIEDLQGVVEFALMDAQVEQA
jgi:hypothetical protein